MSSQRSPPPLAVQLQVTWPGVDVIFELEAPLIRFGKLTSHCCVHDGEPSVTPPQMDGRSRTQLFRYCVAMEIAGLPAPVAEVAAVVGIGFAWSTPEKEYAPTTTDVGPTMVTTMSAVPTGFSRYQNSASLLWNEDATLVNATPPNVTEATLLLFASTPTTSRRLSPVPALKLGRVTW